jgi:hypothetical protein
LRMPREGRALPIKSGYHRVALLRLYLDTDAARTPSLPYGAASYGGAWNRRGMRLGGSLNASVSAGAAGVVRGKLTNAV